MEVYLFSHLVILKQSNVIPRCKSNFQALHITDKSWLIILFRQGSEDAYFTLKTEIENQDILDSQSDRHTSQSTST